MLNISGKSRRSRGSFPRTRPCVKSSTVIDHVAASDAPVTIFGETGTGKELFARALHARSLRREGPLVAVNCSALAESLTESELFGHSKGAFTGAHRDEKGLFEAAHGGTLFLDEIGELPMHLQPKLLRALELGEVRPVGSTTPRYVSVRIVAASNRDLGELVEAGKFREDLFYRLSVLPIKIPPLPIAVVIFGCWRNSSCHR